MVDWTNPLTPSDANGEPAIRSTEDERTTHGNERESYVNREAYREIREKEKRRRAVRQKKMIFNISNRLRLITQTIRAGTCSFARR